MSLPEIATIGAATCKVICEDITGVAADTVLVPSYQDRPGQGGIFAAMQQASAISGCEALKNRHEISSENMLPGSVMTVPSGGGPTGHVTHAASVCEFSEGQRNNFGVVVLSVVSALEDMQRQGLSSITIPLMGTGQMGWLSAEQSARAMLIGVERFTKAHPDAAMQINFCVRSEDEVGAFKQVMEAGSYRNVHDADILKERGKATPRAADYMGTEFRSNDPLANAFSREMPKFTSRESNRTRY